MRRASRVSVVFVVALGVRQVRLAFVRDMQLKLLMSAHAKTNPDDVIHEAIASGGLTG